MGRRGRAFESRRPDWVSRGSQGGNAAEWLSRRHPTPPQGEQIAAGSTVTVDISRGPSLVAVPALRGLTLDSAIAELTTAGLVPGVIRVPSAAPEDTVIAQDPSSGQRVKRGATIRINVSAGTTATTPETVPVTTATTETVETVP